VAKQKRHPCSRWCEQRLHGIADNLKLRGEIPDDFEMQLVPVFGRTFVPKDTLTIRCEHTRVWKIVDVSDVRV